MGLVALGLVAALVAMPLIWFAENQPQIFWLRVQRTFLFTGKSEAERLPALLGNVQKHLLMFNWKGDPNGRHNLPGAPMLDDVTATLMVLGLVYSLRHRAGSALCTAAGLAGVDAAGRHLNDRL